jgi:DNA-binding NtrC family response regulator
LEAALADPRLKLLVVDDDDIVANSIRLVLPQHWSMVHSDKHDSLPKGQYAAALVDMHLTGNLKVAEGLKVVEQLHNLDPHLEIIAMSGDLDRNLMETGLKAGASRFLSKPLTPEELLLTLDKIEALQLLRQASNRLPGGNVPWVGSSDASKEVKRQIASLRGEAGPILIEGESGTGKEVASHLVHFQEGLGRPMVSVNLAALPENVFESEFFGHVRGAFTGADQNKMGLAEAAHGGDLFLDEIEALPMSQQPKLLRFLENGEVRRVGAKESIRVHVRVIAATNQNLEQMVREGKFREDLLWRLNGRKINLPSLRQRLNDIPELVEFLLSRERPRRNKSIDQDAIETLKEHNWPGNVRELKRVCEQLCLHSPLPVIRRQDVLRVLPLQVRPAGSNENIDFSGGIAAAVEAFEASLIRQALQKHEGDVDKTAVVLQISRSSLYKKMKEYHIENRS